MVPAALAAAAPAAAAADHDQARLALSAVLPIVRAVRLGPAAGGPSAGADALAQTSDDAALRTPSVAASPEPASGAPVAAGAAGAASVAAPAAPSPLAAYAEALLEAAAGAAAHGAAERESGEQSACLRPLRTLRLLLTAELATFPPGRSPLSGVAQGAALAALLAPLAGPRARDAGPEARDPESNPDPPGSTGDAGGGGGGEAVSVAQAALAGMAEAGYGQLLAVRALPPLLAAAAGTGPDPAAGPAQGLAPGAAAAAARVPAPPPPRWAGGLALKALEGMAGRGDAQLRAGVVAALAGAAPAALAAAAAPAAGAAPAAAAEALLGALAAGDAAVAGAPALAPALAVALLQAAADLAQVWPLGERMRSSQLCSSPRLMRLVSRVVCGYLLYATCSDRAGQLLREGSTHSCRLHAEDHEKTCARMHRAPLACMTREARLSDRHARRAGRPRGAAANGRGVRARMRRGHRRVRQRGGAGAARGRGRAAARGGRAGPAGRGARACVAALAPRRGARRRVVPRGVGGRGGGRAAAGRGGGRRRGDAAARGACAGFGRAGARGGGGSGGGGCEPAQQMGGGCAEREDHRHLITHGLLSRLARRPCRHHAVLLRAGRALQRGGFDLPACLQSARALQVQASLSGVATRLAATEASGAHQPI